MENALGKFGTFHVVGGGCFGSQYVRWLLKSKARGKIEFDGIRAIDRDPHCQLARKGPKDSSLEIVAADWIEYAAELLQRPAAETAVDHWVPSPLSPHILFLAMLKAARVQGYRLIPAPFRENPPTPVRFELPNGNLAISFAEWTCPVNCIEPDICPATKGPRDWDMKPALAQHFQGRGEEISSQVLQCQHLVHGVGTIPWREIAEAYGKLLEDLKRGLQRVAVATVSSCHGLIGMAEIKKSDPQPVGDDADQEKTAGQHHHV